MSEPKRAGHSHRFFARHYARALAALALLAACSDAPFVGPPAADTVADFASLETVTFITNRAIETDRQGRQRIGNRLGPVFTGECSVGFRKDELTAEVLGVSLDHDRAALSPSFAGKQRRAVIYFHGYYEDFERSCRRAAIFQRRLALDADFLLFTWPANSTPFTYADDVDDLQASVPAFLEALQQLANRYGAGNVSIVGHSLGARGLVRALQDWEHSGEKYRDLVLIAADVDQDLFKASIPSLQSHINRITAIVSDRDLALKLSRVVNRRPRLGQVSSMTFGDITFIDVTQIADTHLSGHIYHLRNAIVVDLIRELLTD